MLRYLTTLAVISAFAGSAFAQNGGEADDAVNLIRQRIAKNLADQTPDADQVRGWLASLKDNGTWADVDYRGTTRSGWSAAAHIRRVQSLAEAWANAGHPLAGDKGLRTGIDRALNHWLAKDYRNPNWWWNEIGVPMSAGRIGVLLGDSLTDAQREKLLGILSRSKIGMTGQNKVWLAGNRVMAGCLADDAKTVGRALSAIESVIRITSDEGLQPDWSFHQHGPQLYMGGYGRGFAIDGCFWARMAHGTPWQFAAKKIDLLRGYLLEGQAWTIHGGELDASATGREITRPGNKARGLIAAARDLAAIDAKHADALNALADRIAGKSDKTGPSGVRVFWRSDYAVARRGGWHVSVKMHSARTIGYEIVNDEGLRSYHLSDGVTWILRRGDEYAGLYPVLDWSRLPGVTARGRGGRVPTGDRKGETRFVGGASAGDVGAAAFDYRRDGVSARKSWFFFDDAVACLGAGIASEAEEPIATTLNQCRLRGPVTVIDGAGRRRLEPAPGQAALLRAKWGQAAWHDGVGYVVIGDADVKLSAGERTGSWHLINERGSREKLTEPVFTLWLDHGRQPAGAGYVYFILPDADAKATEAFAKQPPVAVVANTPALQAVERADAGVAMATFFAKGTVKLLGRDLAVDKPCLLALAGQALAVADPTQRRRVVTVTVDGKPIRIDLPTGPEAGRSVAVELK